MSRPARYVPGGMVYQVLNRGVGRRAVFDKDGDFLAFENVIEETLRTRPMRLGALCQMPNHFLVVWPEHDGHLPPFMRQLTNTHIKRWKKDRRELGFGHLYQGRYKCFPVESDASFYQVVRYVERNPYRAGLVPCAEQWQWSSLRRREREDPSLPILSPWPLPRPRQWLRIVNQPQTEAELAALRRCANRGCPYGEPGWVRKTANQLGLESTLRERGRPKRPAEERT